MNDLNETRNYDLGALMPLPEAPKVVLDIENEDKRFICKCGSKDVVLRPMYGSVSRCRKCNHMWSNA